jgi:uncharacterized cupredoxin-like copper-binding protein
MHAAALELLPILGAEKSKTPFYVLGGALIIWALFVSMGIGTRRPDFPSNLGGERLVIAITITLVLGTAGAAVATSGTPSKGGSSTSGSTPTAPAPTAPGVRTTLPLAANPAGRLSYSTGRLSAKAGQVTFSFMNSSPLPHNMTIAQGSTVLGATPTFQGGVKTLTLSLKPGTYTFYCSVPGHRQAGMEGTLTVS